MLNRKTLIVGSILAFLFSASVAVAAPYYVSQPTVVPQFDNTQDLGTSTKQWRNIYVGNTLCLGIDCRSSWPAGGGGTGGLGTTTPWTALQLVQVVNNSTVKSVATSSLNINTSDLIEGTNLFWTNTRFDNRLSATTSLPNLVTLAGLSLPYSQLTSTPTIPTIGGTSGQLEYNAGGIFGGVATTSVTCSGTVSCTMFSAIGPSPITIMGSGGGGGSGTVSTSTNETSGSLAYWTSNSATPALLGKVATTSFTPSAEFTVGGTIGAFVGGANSTLTLATNGVAYSKLVQAGANTILGNLTGGTANVTAFATSSLGIAISDTTGTLTVSRGGSGAVTLSGVLKGNGTSAFTAAVNGTDFTLITAKTCTGGDFVSSVTAAGVFTCTTPSGTTYTATYPVTLIGTAFGLDFGTTTANVWGPQQTFTLSPKFSTMTAGTVNSTVAGRIYNTATSTPTVTAPITYSGTLGDFTGGISGAFDCTTATGSVKGCLSAADFTTFNAKQAALTFSWPLINTANTVSFGGLSTSTAAVVGNIPYFSGVNTFANVATTSFAANTDFSYSGTLGALVGGAAGTLSLNMATPHSWTGLQTFANSSTSLGSFIYSTSTLGVFGTARIPNLGTAAGAFLAVDPNGNIIATTSPSSSIGGTETPSGTINGSNVTFTTTYAPVALFMNGTYQTPGGVDYTLTGTGPYTITYLIAPLTGSTHTSQYLAGGVGGGTVTSVAASVPGFLSISGSPVTTNGTLAISYSGTALPIANGGSATTTGGFTDGIVAFNGTYHTNYSGYTLTSSKLTATNASTTALSVAGELTGPYSSAPSILVNGDHGFDSTANQFKFMSNGAIRVLMPEQSRSFTYATSSWTGTTTIPLDSVINAYTFTKASCYTDVGTVNVAIGNGTATTTYLSASTTNGIFTYAANNSFATQDKVKVDIGTPSTAPTKIVCTAAYTFNAQ